MARCAIVYGTTEGHTRDIAERLTSALRDAGVDVDAIDATAVASDLAIDQYDSAILAASLHQGAYQESLRKFARAHKDWLSAHPAAFVSVSLSAIGTDEEDRQNLAGCIDQLATDTGWRPALVEHVAGALVFSQYPFFVRQVMKLIARQHGLPTSGEHDYTDYERLTAFAHEFAATLPVRSA